MDLFDKARRAAELEQRIATMLLLAPPDIRKFPGHILICYFLDPPDPGSTQVQCDNCGSSELLGPKSTRLRDENPGRFHVMCGVCGLAVGALQVRNGVTIEPHCPDDWPRRV